MIGIGTVKGAPQELFAVVFVEAGLGPLQRVEFYEEQVLRANLAARGMPAAEIDENGGETASTVVRLK